MGAPIMDGGIRWDRLTEDKFERLIETLLTRYHEARGAQVDAPEGRGGDDGIDVLVRYPECCWVYQIKFFPDGLTKNTVTKKKQIQQSFERAMQTTGPDRWSLCFPAKATNEARKYVEGLPGGRDVQARLCARSHIEAMLDEFPDLRSWVIQDADDYLVDQVRKATFGKQVPQSLDEVVERWDEVRNSDRAIDPDWDIQRISDGREDRILIVPKHKHAQERSPIDLELQLKDTPAAKALQDQVDSIHDYGARQQVDISPEHIERAVLTGPEWLGDWTEPDSVSYAGPATVPDILGRSVAITATGDCGELLAHRIGRVMHGGRGARGISIEAEFFGALSLTVRIPLDNDDSGSIDTTMNPPRGYMGTSYDLPGKDARVAEQVTELLLLIAEPHNSVRVTIEGAPLFRGSVTTSTQDSMLPAIRELAEDLQIIERHTRVSIPIPEEFSQRDRVSTRRLRLLLEGKRTIMQKSGFTVTPSRELDGEELVAGHAMQVTWTGPLDVLGVDVPLPDRVCWNARVRPEGVENSLADIAAGVDPRPFRIVPVDDSPFITWMPSRADGHDLSTTPWGLTGIPEPEEASS